MIIVAYEAYRCKSRGYNVFFIYFAGEVSALASSLFACPFLAVQTRHASKKQGGSTSNGRDSNPKFLGLKAGGGEARAQTSRRPAAASPPSASPLAAPDSVRRPTVRAAR